MSVIVKFSTRIVVMLETTLVLFPRDGLNKLKEKHFADEAFIATPATLSNMKESSETR